jgi:2-keto-3-deoxy-L-rhamnonate aldolase RhmA
MSATAEENALTATTAVTAIEAIGGSRPLKTEEFAIRAHDYTMNPSRNRLKQILDQADSMATTPPLLGIFNDIPWHQFRESEAHAWARAGFSWIANDGEHRQREGWYGTEQNAALNRLGLLTCQRLHREAVSFHGDVFQLGARATMKPYGTTYEQAERFYRAVEFPVPGQATPDDRGGYPIRYGDRNFAFTPDELRGVETETQGWVQFETAEYIIDTGLRDRVLDLMAAQGPNKACGFVGPFDAILREGDLPEIEEAVDALFRAGAERGVHLGRVVGSGSMEDPQQIEDNMVRAIDNGARLICVHPMTGDLTFRGAMTVAEPFFRAAARCGF